MDRMQTEIQPNARYLGNSFNAVEEFVTIFTEEIIRNSLFFAVSVVLKKIWSSITPHLLISDWVIISPAQSAVGKVYFSNTLSEIKAEGFDRSTLLLTTKVSGEEEIPPNAKAVIIINSVDYPDLLAHVSVRARNEKALFCVCLNSSKGEDLKKLSGEICSLTLNNGNVQCEIISELEERKYFSHPKESSEQTVLAQVPISEKILDKYLLTSDEYDPLSVRRFINKIIIL
jgi:alpha-glucan, water dikinase